MENLTPLQITVLIALGILVNPLTILACSVFLNDCPKVCDAICVCIKSIAEALKTWLSPKVVLIAFAVLFAAWQINRLVTLKESEHASVNKAYEKLAAGK